MEQYTAHILDIDKRKLIISSNIENAKNKIYDGHCVRTFFRYYNITNNDVQSFLDIQLNKLNDTNNPRELAEIEFGVNTLIKCRLYR